jgi:solute carrier family 27 fatty acid transporter 1/4
VKRFPDKVAIYYKDEKWTFKQLDDFSNQVANCFINLGYRPYDELALLMDNRPEFIGIWLGLVKTGIIPAFINTKNRNDTLIHSIKVVNCKAIIFDAKLYECECFECFY